MCTKTNADNGLSQLVNKQRHYMGPRESQSNPSHKTHCRCIYDIKLQQYHFRNESSRWTWENRHVESDYASLSRVIFQI